MLRTCWPTILVCIVSAHLDHFSDDFVLNFLNLSQNLDVSEDCRTSLGRVHEYLLDHDTLEAQKEYYFQSFGQGMTGSCWKLNICLGPSSLFLSRDQDRWVYRGYECLLSAGETVYSKSEHPMHYCYSHEDDPASKVDAFSVCIPTPCAGDHVKLIKQFRRLSKPSEEDKPIDAACTRSRHEKQWFEQFVPVADLAFNLALTAFVIMATIFHKMRGNRIKTIPARILMAFSLKRNAKKLTQLPKDPQACITCMFGLRFMSMVWTLIGHSFIFVQGFLENVDDYKNDLVDNFYNQWITNFTLSVDVFLVLGGCVLSYSWFRKWLKTNSEPEPTWTSWGYWLRFYRHRIVRLWPAYLYTVMAVTLRVSITHFHPMWPPTDPAVQCPKYWWQNVLFINSLFDNRCMPWTWYIGTEFIFYLISPIFLLLLRRNTRLGMTACCLTIAASAGVNTWKIVAVNFPPTQFLWKQPELFNPNFIQHHIELYIKPQYRVGPYLIGILLGYYLAKYQRQVVKIPRSVNFIVGGWVFSACCLFYGLYGLYPSLQAWDWPIYHIIYGTIHRDVFALGIAWLIYACHTEIGGVLNKILSASPLLPLSNLCYSVYLFHMIPVVLTYLLVPFPLWYGSKWPILIHCLVQLTISYGFAAICTLCIEYPALNIEAILLSPRIKTTLKPVQTSDSELQLKSPSPKL